MPGGPKYVDVFCQDNDPGSNATMIAGALVHVECVVDRIFEVSKHTLFIGNVEEVVSRVDREGGPLLHFNRTFYELGDPLE